MESFAFWYKEKSGEKGCEKRVEAAMNFKLTSNEVTHVMGKKWDWAKK